MVVQSEIEIEVIRNEPFPNSHRWYTQSFPSQFDRFNRKSFFPGNWISAGGDLKIENLGSSRGTIAGDFDIIQWNWIET